MNICKECAHCRPDQTFSYISWRLRRELNPHAWLYARCAVSIKDQNPVTGDVDLKYCTISRDHGPCGTDGKLYETPTKDY